MEKIPKEEIDNKFFFKSSKRLKKSKNLNSLKKNFDSHTNFSENSSVITNLKKSEPKFTQFSSNLQNNVLFKYSGCSAIYHVKKTSADNFNSKELTKNQSNSLIPSVKYTPHFSQLNKIELSPIENCNTPNKKPENKKSKSKNRRHKNNYIKQTKDY